MATDVEVIPKAETRAVAVVTPREQAGTLAMAHMSDDEFKNQILALKRGAARIQQIKRELMEDGVHFGVIVGSFLLSVFWPKRAIAVGSCEVLREVGVHCVRFFGLATSQPVLNVWL